MTDIIFIAFGLMLTLFFMLIGLARRGALLTAMAGFIGLIMWVNIVQTGAVLSCQWCSNASSNISIGTFASLIFFIPVLICWMLTFVLVYSRRR
jgi:hypothetical protein